MRRIRIRNIRRASLRRAKINKITMPFKIIGIITFATLMIFTIMPENDIIIAEEKYDNINYIYYRIESGDNLWNISKEYRPEFYNINQYINIIKKINHIEDNNIQYGEWLTIPIYK